MKVTAQVHREEGSYWAEVPGLPGVFASGETFDELIEGLEEVIALYLADDDECPHTKPRLEVAEVELTDQPLPA